MGVWFCPHLALWPLAEFLTPSCGLSPFVHNRRCCNAIKKLCSAGNITEVFAVLEDMMSRGLVPDIKTVKTIMRTCVKKLAW